jgi:hypothetical protein
MLLRAYRKYRGIVTMACKTTEISRDTFYRWRRDNKVFDFLIERALDDSNDWAESLLLQKMEKGQLQAIMFYLRAHHPRYADNKTVTHKLATPSWYERMTGKTKGYDGKDYSSPPPLSPVKVRALPKGSLEPLEQVIPPKKTGAERPVTPTEDASRLPPA